MDAAQVESGNKASPYRSSALDSSGYGTNDSKKNKNYPAPVHIAKLTEPPVIDGAIEGAWKNAAKVTEFLIKGSREPSERTEAFIGCDNENLYLAFKCCFQKNYTPKSTASARDSGKIWGDDVVEFFLDTNLDRATYFHFAVNPKGVVADVDDGSNIGWKGDWTAAASVNREKGCRTAEIKIPLNILKLSSATSDKWGINLCRSDQNTKEFSCTALYPEINYHKVDYYGIYIWPKGILKRYALDINNIKIAENPATSAYNLNLNIVNRTGRTLSVKAVFERKGKVIAESGLIQLPLNDSVPVSIPCKQELTRAKDIKLQCKIVLQSGKVLTSFSARVTPVRAIEIFFQWNYYMNEKNAVLTTNLNIPDISKLSANVLLIDKAGKQISEQHLTSLSSLMHILIPIANIPIGKYKAVLQIFKEGVALTKAQTYIIKRAYQANAVRIDRERLCIIVDGKPFFPIAPLIQFVKVTDTIEPILKHFRDAGFKTLMSVMGVKHAGFYDVHDILAELTTKYDMKWILWPAGFRAKQFNADRLVKRYGKTDSLIAWMPVDQNSD